MFQDVNFYAFVLNLLPTNIRFHFVITQLLPQDTPSTVCQNPRDMSLIAAEC